MEKMKKYIYILFAALLAVACVEPLQPYLGPIDNEPEEGAPVIIEFSLPPTTKADWGYKPTIKTMHVMVFNSRGVLKQYQEATLSNPAATVDNPQQIENGDQGAANPKYSVEINMSSNERILHFIANSPVSTLEELIALAGSSGEDAILNALTTSGGDAAYWQRVKLDKIDAYTYDGVSYPKNTQNPRLQGNPASYLDHGQRIYVYKGDFIKSNGDKVLDGTGYFMSDYVKGALQNIPLIRNYAEIKVTEGTGTQASNFHPKKFALVYVPKAGSVAPFDTPNNRFADAYRWDSSVFSETLSYSGVHGTGYAGFLASSIDPNYDAEDPKWNPDAQDNNFINFSSGTATAYMYERPLPTAQQLSTCILVCGDMDNVGTNRWFKIEITDTSGGYFPIYRGLSYDFVIGRIDGTKGYDTAAEAFNHDPIGDVSGSVTTATIEQINDGKGTTLWVEYIDYVTTQAENKTIYYTMYYQATTGATPQYLTRDVTLTVSHPNAQYKATDAPTLTGSEYNGTGTPDDTKTWYVATVPLKDPGDHALHSILKVEGTTPAATGSKKMHRDVHYRVMDIQNLQNGDNILKATPLENEEKDQETTLTIYLPGDLGFSMFPITLRIEAENGNYTTADGLPVESGPSMFESNSNKQVFYFLKTIEYDDYFKAETGAYNYAFTAKFKTTRDCTGEGAGTNATHFRVQDKLKTGRTTYYFNPATCDVRVGGPVFKIDGESSVTVNANVTEVTMKIKNTTGGTWTLTKGAGVTSVNPESGSGNGEITVRIPANTDENNTKTYTVQANLDIDGYQPLEFSIMQNPAIRYESVTRTIATTSSTFNTSYAYTGEFSSEVSIACQGAYNRTNGYIDFENTGSGITLSANTITEIEITWYSTTYAANNTTVSSGGGSTTFSTSGQYPTTRWTNASGSNTVSLSFARSGNSTQEFTIRQIKVTYLHPAE